LNTENQTAPFGGRGANVVVTLFDRQNDIDGRRKESTWQELVDAITNEPEASPTKDGACFLFGDVRPDGDGKLRHKKDQVVALYALGIDVDDAPEEKLIESIAELGDRGLQFVAWPTFSQLAQPEEGLIRCRLVFPLSRPVLGKEWPKFWERAVRHLGLKTLADLQCKDSSRLFFHTYPQGQLATFREWCDTLSSGVGAALDVDAILATDPETRPVVDLDAKEIVDGATRLEPCPLGRPPFEHAEHLCRTMPPAISGSGGHNATLRVARALVWGLELDPMQASSLIEEIYNPRCEPPWSLSEIEHKVEAAAEPNGATYAKGALLPPTADLPSCLELLTTDANGRVQDTAANVATLLQLHPDWLGVLRFDAFANRVVCAKEPPMREQDRPNQPCVGAWTDAHTMRARFWIASKYDFEPGKDAIDSAIEVVARRNTFHPVQDYLTSLRWDGTPRIHTLLSTYFGAKASPYTRAVGSKFMISAVARAMKPGSKVDTMLILEGLQGTRKSTAVRTLAGDAWFADTALDLKSKDAAQSLQGKWIYEIGELHAFNRAETTQIKAFVSSQSDNFRPSYGRRNADFPRQVVFVGTTNGTEYLTDTTGNRRFWPVRCGVVDVGGLFIDRDQLWAEALARFNEGEHWWLDGDAEALAADEQAEREAIDPWESALEKWAAARESFTMQQALVGLGVAQEHQTQAQSSRAGKLLAKLGWDVKRRRSGEGSDGDGSKIVRVYVRKP
jgi:hypothetical protein